MFIGLTASVAVSSSAALVVLQTEAGVDMDYESGDPLIVNTAHTATADTAIDGTEYAAVVQGGTTKKVTLSVLKEALA